MARVLDFRVPDTDEVLKVATMTFAQAEEFVNQSREMLKRADVSAEEWNAREHATVAAAINLKADEIKTRFDIPTIHEIYSFILEKSGLKPAATSTGEAPAAASLTSAKPAAA